MVTIRLATPDDAPALHKLITGLAGQQNLLDHVTVTPGQLAGVLARPEAGSLLAEEDGRAIGYVSWVRSVSFWLGSEYIHLDDLYVTEDMRGRGVGERLMRTLADLNPDTVIRWEVQQDNIAAQRFYERLGAKILFRGVCNWRP
ncbi:GNAT family N-acetyltransferase [Sinosporangium siamense]|uniref:N-acetyltransferase n=1 Tax=Sinosporangium siamense TaxID=1367973 RepID=A0A919RPL3_9ACTN|nr:GNAT family N-acetyltransferase [Sinosporangium siamense]GII97403.1 N-acetyltransferase [Sinosporangium siamense]